MMRWGVVGGVTVALLCGVFGTPFIALSADDGSTITKSSSRSHRDSEILEIKQAIHALEHRVEQLEGENADLRKTNTQLKDQAQKAETTTTQQIQTLQTQVTAAPSSASFSEAFNRYLGRNRFTLAGGAAGSFVYDRQSSINSFALELEPIILWQLNDRMLFEGTIKANLPSGSSADFQLPVATLQYFLNDYVELAMGIFDQPFGDWYEDQSSFWVNRFITAPLPYGVNAVVPGTDVGVQLRGGFQWGETGQVADYTIWAANGPGFSNSTCSDSTAPGVHPSCPSPSWDSHQRQ